MQSNRLALFAFIGLSLVVVVLIVALLSLLRRLHSIEIELKIRSHLEISQERFLTTGDYDVPYPKTKPTSDWRFSDAKSLINSWVDPIDLDFPNRKFLLKQISPFLEERDTKLFMEHLTYAQNCCEVSGPRNVASALNFGFDYSEVYNHSDLSLDFRERNKELLRRKKGAGYWVWKPRILWQRMMQAPLSRNYVLFYTDAGSYFTRHIRKYLKDFVESDEDIRLGSLPYPQMAFTRRDVFIRMGLDRGLYHTSPQTPGGFVLVKNTLWARYFIGEWMRGVQSPVSVGDSFEFDGYQVNHITENFPNYEGHRHDQSILALLATKYRVRQVKGEPFFLDSHWRLFIALDRNKE